MPEESFIITGEYNSNVYIIKIIIHTGNFNHPPHVLPPAPGVMKFTILVDPSLVIITIYLVCLIYAWE